MEQGTCKYGDNCDFAHGITELQQKQHVNPLFKTQVCKNFLLNNCRFGDRCHFLHPQAKTDEAKNTYKESLLKNSVELININMSKMKEPKFDITESKFKRLSVFKMIKLE